MPTAGQSARRPAAKSKRLSIPAERVASGLAPTAAARKATPTATEVRREREIVFNALRPLTELLSRVVGSNVEVVLHDLSRPERSIVAITNGHISGRSVGDPILSGPKQDKGFASAVQALSARGQPTHSIIEGYNTVTAAGNPLRSTTALYRDSQGEPFAALCINADLTVVQMAHAWLGRMLDTTREPLAARAPEEAPQIDALIEEIIADAVNRFGKPVQLMSKDEKIHAVEAMLERGLFMVRGGVERAAAALKVTRFTVYNYLEILRSRGAVAESEEASAAPRRTRRRAATASPA